MVLIHQSIIRFCTSCFLIIMSGLFAKTCLSVCIPWFHYYYYNIILYSYDFMIVLWMYYYPKICMEATVSTLKWDLRKQVCVNANGVKVLTSHENHPVG
jgi:hypothetical protein